MKRVLVWVVCVYLALSTARGAVVTYFPETDIGGGIIAKAQATITGGSTYLDIVVQNTSDLGPLIDGKRANPFITEIEFKYLPGFTLDEENSYASSLSGTLFAQDIGNEANNLSVRHLYYNFVSSDSPGMNRCFMTMDADNIKNDSTIGSINVLDGVLKPQEGWAVGFLKADPKEDSGTVFDAALFHFEFLPGAGSPPESYLANPDNFVVKFVGGGYSQHVYNVPEPATVLLLGLGGLAFLRKRKV